jgi:hypothetical protein
MKKVLAFIASIGFLISCSEKKEDTSTTEVTTTTSTTEKPKPTLIYDVRYSDWEMGDQELINNVLRFYKSWDAKDLNNVDGLFADTVKMRLPEERSEIVLTKDKVTGALAKNRGMYGTTRNEIISAVSLRDKKSGEDWVMITTYSKWIEDNGKRDSVLYHDDWRLKDGKIAFLMSYYKLPTKTFLKTNDITGEK